MQWRQTLGSSMHCATDDGIGILAGAVLATAFNITGLAEIALEYLLGFGWSVFQALTAKIRKLSETKSITGWQPSVARLRG